MVSRPVIRPRTLERCVMRRMWSLVQILSASWAVLLASPDAAAQIVEESIDPYTFQPEKDSVVVDATTVDVAQILDDLGPVAQSWYQHVMTLSNPFFEGRAPGSEGMDRAADYVEFWFQREGLEPAFGDDSFRQNFSIPGGRPQITRSAMKIDGVGLEVGRDFTVLSNSGSGTIAAPLAFVGYAIDEGPDGYTSFTEESDDLSGRVALMFRYEPLDEEGRSRFTSRRFSQHSAMAEKMAAVEKRGASGVVLVNPPGALFAQDGLEDGPSGRFGEPLDIPVVQVTPTVAARILASIDPGGRTLEEWRSVADEGGHGMVSIGDGGSDVVLETGIDNGMRQTANIGGILPGRGELADEWIVIGAHYDHVGFGGFGAMPGNRGRLHPGADDNASGTAALIELVPILRAMYDDDGDRPLRSVLLIAFTAEESGLIGSRYYVEHPTLPAGGVNLMLNLDMIGRLRSDTLAVGGFDSADGLFDLVRPELEKSGLRVVADGNPRGASDHASFYGAGIPVLFFFTGTHDVYHQPGDLGWTVNPRGAAKVIDLVGAVAWKAVSEPDRLVFGTGDRRAEGGEQTKPDPGRSSNDRGYAAVRLGIRPGMSGGSGFGVAVESVSDGTSASEGGIQAGDVIVAWGGEDLLDVMDMVTRLREHQPGDVVPMVILRDGKEIELNIVMKASERANPN